IETREFKRKGGEEMEKLMLEIEELEERIAPIVLTSYLSGTAVEVEEGEPAGEGVDSPAEEEARRYYRSYPYHRRYY
ncbi:MAG: hypothetical protein ACE5G5_06005, partial [Candidatus Methylomirabilales bacterium]